MILSLCFFCDLVDVLKVKRGYIYFVHTPSLEFVCVCVGSASGCYHQSLLSLSPTFSIPHPIQISNLKYRITPSYILFIIGSKNKESKIEQSNRV